MKVVKFSSAVLAWGVMGLVFQLMTNAAFAQSIKPQSIESSPSNLEINSNSRQNLESSNNSVRQPNRVNSQINRNISEEKFGNSQKPDVRSLQDKVRNAPLQQGNQPATCGSYNIL
jgi:hypothetical protein